MCRVWPVDEFQISLRGRVGLGGAFLPGNPHYSYMYKARRTPPQDITLIKTKMTARNDKRFISTFLRKNSGLWTVYNLWAISVEALFVYDLIRQPKL